MKKINLPILIPIVVLLALLFPVTGNASPVRATVVLTVDTVLDNAALTTCSSTVANDCSLRGAIIKVNTNPNTSYQINIPSGTYNLTIQGSGENNAQTGDLDIRRSVTIVGASANDPTLTEISAGLISDRIIHILSPSNGAQINVTIRNLTITDGTSSDGGNVYVEGNTVTLQNVHVMDGDSTNGAGVFNKGGNLSVISSFFSGNKAATGGGLYNANNGSVSILNTLFVDNEAVISGGGLINFNGTMTITSSIIRENFATAQNPGRGGGISNGTSGTLTISGSTIEMNRADGANFGGGGIYNRGNLTITQQTVVRQNDVLQGGSGGGIYSDGGLVIIQDSTVTENKTHNNGGGIANIDPSNMNLTNVQVSNNRAVQNVSNKGGGIQNTGTMNISDSEINGNTIKTGYGGGIANGDDPATGCTCLMTIYSSMVSGNQSMPSNVVTSYGVGIYNRGLLIIDGTEVNENILNGYGGWGGGIYSTYGSLQILNESTIANNVIVSGNFPVPPDDAYGGGIHSRDDDFFIIRDSSIQGNYAGLADGSVGGIYVYGVGKELLVDNVLVSNNESVGLGGSTGGAFFFNPDGVTTIRNSTIQENISSDADDGTTGGIDIAAAGGDVIVESSIIQNNFAGDPAGPYTGASTGGIDINAFDIRIDDTVIFGNTGQDDGGITINQANSFSLISSSVISNSAIGAGKGGGLTIRNTQLTSIENSTFAHNFANEHGGAIYFSAGYNEKLIITNSTFSNNTAGLSESGGAIYTAFSSVIINNSTFVNNFAGGSPNMIKISDADVVFRNSLISDMPFIINPAHCVIAVGASATISSNGYNLESGNSCGFTQPGDIQNATAQVSPLSNNGGLTQTHALPAGHDAIDGGDPLGCYADFDGDGIAEALLTKDQRGYPRPLDGDGNSSAFCDIGAFEYP